MHSVLHVITMNDFKSGDWREMLKPLYTFPHAETYRRLLTHLWTQIMQGEYNNHDPTRPISEWDEPTVLQGIIAHISKILYEMDKAEDEGKSRIFISWHEPIFEAERRSRSGSVSSRASELSRESRRSSVRGYWDYEPQTGSERPSLASNASMDLRRRSSNGSSGGSMSSSATHKPRRRRAKKVRRLN
jgi:hypothetical protein